MVSLIHWLTIRARSPKAQVWGNEWNRCQNTIGAGAAPTDYDWTAVDSLSDPATYLWFDEATITEAIDLVASSTPFKRLAAKGKASFPSGREEGASPIQGR